MQLNPKRALIVSDLTGEISEHLQSLGAVVTRRDPQTFNEEQPHKDAEYDIIIDCGSIATVNDLPAALIHYHRALAAGGNFFGSIIGAGSLPQLRRSMLASNPDRPAPRIHPMIDSATASALLSRAGFSRQVVGGQPLRVSYRSLTQLVCDLRDQGLSNALSDIAAPLGKAELQRAQTAFLGESDEHSRVTETFEILSMAAWKN